MPGVGTHIAGLLGDPLNGVWMLCGADSAAGNAGTLVYWTLSIDGL